VSARDKATGKPKPPERETTKHDEKRIREATERYETYKANLLGDFEKVMLGTVWTRRPTGTDPENGALLYGCGSYVVDGVQLHDLECRVLPRAIKLTWRRGGSGAGKYMCGELTLYGMPEPRTAPELYTRLGAMVRAATMAGP
jgi:hypothetical protein